MNIRLYNTYSEIESELKSQLPKVMYKYREFNSPNGLDVLNGKFWLAKPSSLNDEFDLRPPLRFKINEIDDLIFFNKLKEGTKILHPGLIGNDIDRVTENKLDEIRKDPLAYFQQNYEDLVKTPVYESMGLLSCSVDPLNLAMWRHYSLNGNGFCIGVITSELVKHTNPFCGFVIYSDEAIEYSFINTDYGGKEFFIKQKQCAFEKEFRFLKFELLNDRQRELSLPLDAIKEIYLGYNISKENRNRVLTYARQNYKHEYSIFQTEIVRSGQTRLVTKKIN